MTTTRRMTYDDLMALPEDGGRHELVRGEIRVTPPPKGGHGGVESALDEAIARYLYNRATDLGWRAEQGRLARVRLVGYLAVGEAGMRFSLPDDADQIRAADLLYLPPAQFARAEAALRDEHIPFVPALVTEVVSRTDRPAEVAEKVADYLAGGARLVWLLHPTMRTVTVHSPDEEPRTISMGGFLDGGAVLPGFAVPLNDLFL